MNSLFAALALFAVVDIGELFSEKSAWEETAVDFAVDHARDGFTFASQKRDIVNCLRRGAAKWLGRDVWETRIFYTPNAGPRQIELSLFNSGDRMGGESYSSAQIDRLIADIQAKYGGGVKTPPKSEKSKLKTGGVRYECVWRKSDPVIELSWGLGDAAFTPVRYVRVSLSPKTVAQSKGAVKPVSGQVAAAKVKANVRKNAEGDVWIDGVPMVDQGQKGYCAAAVSERILRYYGHDIDEHEIAQQAGSRAVGGTRTDDMIAVVREIGVKKHLAFNQIVATPRSLEELEKDVDQYNKVAKSMKEPEVSVAAHTYGLMIMVSEIYDEMKPKVLKKMRTKDARYRKFLTGVKTQIDKGVPICWGVTLGIFPEPGVNPQSKGGHMRLIIGYNAKTHEILYSDTWGAGHELKRMPEDWAFTITHEAFFLRPL